MIALSRRVARRFRGARPLVLGAATAAQGQAAQLTRFHHGLLAEVVMYERALDDDELAGVEQYLQQKWGL